MADIACNCAAEPPTMPVYRAFHLPTCRLSPYFSPPGPTTLTGAAAIRAAEILERRGL